MLDDLKYIHQKDAQDALGIAEKQWQQLGHEFTFSQPIQTKQVSQVIYAGMGGSALAAQFIFSWPGLKHPFEISRSYHLPAYTDENTLVIVGSYSGNTEETLSALEEAESKSAQTVIIAGGGKLAEIATGKGYPLINLPKAAQPRYAVLYNFKAIVEILKIAGLVDSGRVDRELTQAALLLKEAVQPWLPTVPTEKNPAKQLALELMGKSPVVYAGPLLFPAAYKWKISFNENAKNIAWCSQYPEFNHNEFIGWTGNPAEKPYAVIDLRSNLENARIRQRFEISDRLLSGRRPAAHIVEAKGENELEQLLWTVAFGDFVSLYLALLNGVNPTPVQLVERLKKELA